MVADLSVPGIIGHNYMRSIHLDSGATVNVLHKNKWDLIPRKFRDQYRFHKIPEHSKTLLMLLNDRHTIKPWGYAARVPVRLGHSQALSKKMVIMPFYILEKLNYNAIIAFRAWPGLITRIDMISEKIYLGDKSVKPTWVKWNRTADEVTQTKLDQEMTDKLNEKGIMQKAMRIESGVVIASSPGFERKPREERTQTLPEVAEELENESTSASPSSSSPSASSSSSSSDVIDMRDDTDTDVEEEKEEKEERNDEDAEGVPPSGSNRSRAQASSKTKQSAKAAKAKSKPKPKSKPTSKRGKKGKKDEEKDEAESSPPPSSSSSSSSSTKPVKEKKPPAKRIPKKAASKKKPPPKKGNSNSNGNGSKSAAAESDNSSSSSSSSSSSTEFKDESESTDSTNTQ